MVARKDRSKLKMATNIALVIAIVLAAIVAGSNLLQQRRQSRYWQVAQGLKQDFKVILPDSAWRIFLSEDNTVTIRAELSAITNLRKMQKLVVAIKEGISERYPVKYVRLVQVGVEGRRDIMVKAVDFILER